ncbi:MAG: hypothetical protein ACI94Y_003631 [Maribacter sp.]|jgi:uncharacterized protein (DUF1684 family)
MKYSNLLFISISFIIVTTIFSCDASKRIKLLDSTTQVDDVKAFQDKINGEYKSEESPLDEEDKADFEGLNFFPTDAKYQVLADFVRTPEEKPFAMKTSTDRTPIYIKYGEATFRLQNDTITLSLYRNPKLSRIEAYKYYLFLPFTDLTNGNTSYGGGRYIDLLIPKGNKIIIDFNKSYNPYCCYSDKFSCPVPPKENFMDLEIQAGVRTISE